MKKQPKISVIIPVYNAERYLTKCIDSVLMSTLKDIELILVNDGSKDTSPQICDEYAYKDKRVVVIHQENKRQAHARNQGIKVAKGEYISFIDADDYVDPLFFEKLYYAAKNNDSDVAVSNVITVPSSVFNYVGHWSFHKNKKILTLPADKIGPIYSCAIWNKIYRRSFLEKNGLYFNEDIFLEDVTFNQIATILSNCICLEDSAIYFYNCTNEVSFMHLAHKSDKVIEMSKMTQLTKSFLKGKCDSIYFSILDAFEIYNLWGWFNVIEDRVIKENFLIQLKSIFSSINVDDNPFISSSNKKIWRSVLNAKTINDLIECNTRYIFLFGLFTVTILNNKCWKISIFQVPVIKRKEKGIYCFGMPLLKIKKKC